VDSRLEALPTH